MRRYLSDDKVFTELVVSALLSENAFFEADGLGRWVIETDTLGAVGMAGLTPVAGPHESEVDMTGEIESTIANAPTSWVRGLVRAALAALIHYALDGLKLIGLVAAADAPNADTHRLLLTCEFERFGEDFGPFAPIHPLPADVSSTF